MGAPFVFWVALNLMGLSGIYGLHKDGIKPTVKIEETNYDYDDMVIKPRPRREKE